MAPFRSFFTAPVWEHVLVLVTGMVLAPGKRTVSAVLRVMGLGETRDFALYHYVLSRARCSSSGIARYAVDDDFGYPDQTFSRFAAKESISSRRSM